jgi:predicted small metal-binding protein
MAGAAGIVGCAFMTKLSDIAEVQPEAFVTV